MTKTSKILSVLLAGQVGLFLFLQLKSNEPLAAFNKTDPLLTVAVDTVTKIVIDDGEKKTLTLLKKDAAWQLPEHFNFPVATTKIQEIMDKVKDFKKSWPAGKTMIAAKQFKVTPEQFERKVQLFHDDKVLATLYLGTSPGFRQVYVRMNEDTQTYAVSFNAHDVPTKASEWYDKKFYSVKVEDVESLDLPTLKIAKKDTAFTVEGTPAGKVADQAKIKGLIDHAAMPTFEDVIEKPAKMDPVLTYTLKSKGEAQPVTYQYFAEVLTDAAKKENKKPENYYLQISKFPAYTFQLRAYAVKEFQDAKVDSFVTEEKKEESKATAPAPEAKPAVSTGEAAASPAHAKEKKG